MPHANQKMIDRVMKLREQVDPETGKEFSFRAIAKKLRKDIKSVFTWYQFGSGQRTVAKLGRPRAS